MSKRHNKRGKSFDFVFFRGAGAIKEIFLCAVLVLLTEVCVNVQCLCIGYFMTRN